jgi:hypothetical protein
VVFNERIRATPLRFGTIGGMDSTRLKPEEIQKLSAVVGGQLAYPKMGRTADGRLEPQMTGIIQ